MPFDKAAAETALALVQATQTAYWNALAELEAKLGFDVDDNRDFDDIDVDGLLAEAEEEQTTK